MANPPPPSGTKSSSPARLIAIFCLALIVLVGLVVLITWLVIKPKKIQFSIDEGWIRDYNLTNGKLNSTFNFVVRAYNANNKASIYYDSMKVTVSYRGQTVSSDTIEPFFQPHKNVTRFLLQNAARNVPLPGVVVHDLKVERTGGEVDLDIRLQGKIRERL
ncbi:hypothetical protein Cgig2_013791 [Carnegiea gigantea]|uniref:Late embryogenesis abundant protein LEA-2 subgroup domain-containing protein n=1 Tax=Carnegiea gigantea TaxID=171969 RepID=A0A9Q1Q5S0_9CARY|nr:hypothetical protein Cgig2_013791 [Carnegiea gigantea]